MRARTRFGEPTSISTDFRERRFGPGSDGLGGTDANDPFGDVFVVLDDYDDLYTKDTVLGDRIISLSSRGPEYGVHVMCCAGGWIHGQRQKPAAKRNGANPIAAGRARREPDGARDDRIA